MFQIHQIPIRDWNQLLGRQLKRYARSKFIKSLLGIETHQLQAAQDIKMFQIHQIPIRDWNFLFLFISSSRQLRSKFIKSLLGIETIEALNTFMILAVPNSSNPY